MHTQNLKELEDHHHILKMQYSQHCLAKMSKRTTFMKYKEKSEEKNRPHKSKYFKFQISYLYRICTQEISLHPTTIRETNSDPAKEASIDLGFLRKYRICRLLSGRCFLLVSTRYICITGRYSTGIFYGFHGSCQCLQQFLILYIGFIWIQFIMPDYNT